MAQGFRSAVPGPLLIHCALVGVVVQRKVLAPDCRVRRVVIDLDDAEERILGFLLAFDDVDEQRRHGRCCKRRQGDDQHQA